MYILQWEKDYQRFEWVPLKAWRRGAWHALLRQWSWATMMVHESYFNYFSYTIVFTSPTVFTVRDLKALIQQKIHTIKISLWYSDLVYHYCIDRCMVEYEPSLHVLWKKGNLSFVLNVMVLRHVHVLELKKHCSPRAVTIIPKHLWVVSCLGLTMRWPVSLIHFQKNEIIALWCQNWRYTSIEVAPFWLELLYQSFKDHDIAAYLYNDIERLDKNILLRKTVEEVFTFFLKQCVSWMHQQALFGKPCVIICPFSKHPVFVEIMKSLSRPYHTWGFIPFSWWIIGETGDSDDLLVVKAWKHKKK